VTITLSSGKLTVQPVAGDTVNVTGPAEIAGMTLNGVTINLTPTGSLYMHGCMLTGAYFINFQSPTAGNRIVYNTMTPTSNFSISGYPGANNTISNNKVNLLSVTGTAQSLADLTSGKLLGSEWLHLQATCSGLNISNNTIVGGWVRWLIELQEGMTNLTVANNYGTQYAGPALSCATGGSATAPFGGQGENISITGNTFISQYAGNTNCGGEIMGDKAVSIAGNFLSGYSYGILNGTGGQQNQPLTSSANTFICTNVIGNDNVPWPIPPCVCPSVTDKVYKIGAAGNPAPPAMPTNVGAAFDPPIPAVQPALAAVLALTNNADGTVTIVSPTAVSQVAIAPSTPSAAAPPVTLAVNPPASTIKVGPIPANWVVSVAAGGLQAQTPVTGGPAAAANNGWAATLPAIIAPVAAVVTPPPGTAPATISIPFTFQGHAVSTDGGKTWAATQP
jgi:hypothetical protein